jgi:prepilin-type N-terminal cleavage/methylation domain-containing protein
MGMKIVPSFSGRAVGALSVRVGGDSAPAVVDAPLQGRGRNRAGRLQESPVFQRPDSKRRAAAFTLIELLVVITIIAILASLSFAGVDAALNAARKAQARNDVQQIVTAVKAFQAEYGRMPTTRSPGSPASESDPNDAWHEGDNNIVMRILMAQETSALPINAKGIVFIEPKARQNLRKGSVDLSNYVFYDPWGRPYAIKLDNNYTGKLEYWGTGGQPNIFNSAFAISSGQDKSFGNPFSGTGTGKDDICSFK